MTVLELRGITKRFKKLTVLENLDLDVPKGSVFGLLGKNGAGKTTLIKCALGLIKPQSGTVKILDEPAWTLSAQGKAKLGYVPQIIHLYGWMKIRQLIAYTSAFYPHWNDTLAARLLSDFELAAEDPVGTLSLGQTQKLALILAMGHEPEFLVLDEPASALDPAARRKFIELVLEITSKKDRTILLSTHLISDLERVATRIAVLKDHRIAFSGAPQQLKDQYGGPDLEEAFLSLHRA